MRYLRTAYFETDPEVFDGIAQLKQGHMKDNTTTMLNQIDRTPFKDPHAPELLLELFTLTVEGYMTFHTKTVYQHPEQVMKDLNVLISSLKQNYYKQEKARFTNFSLS